MFTRTLAGNSGKSPFSPPAAFASREMFLRLAGKSHRTKGAAQTDLARTTADETLPLLNQDDRLIQMEMRPVARAHPLTYRGVLLIDHAIFSMNNGALVVDARLTSVGAGAASVDLRATSTAANAPSIEVRATAVEANAKPIDVKANSVDLASKSIAFRATSIDFRATSVDPRASLANNAPARNVKYRPRTGFTFFLGRGGSHGPTIAMLSPPLRTLPIVKVASKRPVVSMARSLRSPVRGTSSSERCRPVCVTPSSSVLSVAAPVAVTGATSAPTWRCKTRRRRPCGRLPGGTACRLITGTHFCWADAERGPP